jgi:hypothetical protein
VSVYNQALTAGQVSDDYAAAVNGVAPAPAAPASAYRDTVLGEADLVSYWRLGEASGTTAKDSRGTNDGSYLTGVTLGSPGAATNDPNSSATFNGTSAKVSLPALAPVTDFSVEGWTKLAAGAASGSGNNTLYGSNAKVRLLARPGGGSSPTTAYAGVWLAGTEYVLQPNSTAQSNLGAWVHWVMTRSAGTLTLYRNGVRIGRRTDLPASASADISGWIGAQTGNAYFLNGQIDDVSVYRSALGATAIANHYRAALSGPAPAP